jgi:hypothetical protein
MQKIRPASAEVAEDTAEDFLLAGMLFLNYEL